MVIDYAPIFGFNSVAAPALFAVLYLGALGWFVRQYLKHRVYVYIVLVVFCLFRLVAYTIRAILADHTVLSTTLGWFIADQVLFGVGFFALLYSAYTLILDRELASGSPPPDRPLARLLRQRTVFRAVLLIGVVLGVIGSTPSSYSSETRIAGTIVFLVLAALQALLAFAVVRAGLGASSSKLGDRYAGPLLILISLLLLVRQAFLTIVTLGEIAAQNDERLWFALVALTEFVAVMCYAVPGLVPTSETTERLPTMHNPRLYKADDVNR
ncbi:hypothetical protein C8R43DRAFT_556800 [Mycena crocata]|nr:hypothetical protein C8R43DRAFT_556800 [Mycena crocata]